MKYAAFLIVCLLFPSLLFSQTALPPIPGWTMENISGRYKFTPPGGNFEYDVMPIETEQVSNLADWVKTWSLKDLQTSGFSAPLSSPAPITKYVQSAFTYTVMATDQQNKKWGIIYIAYKLPDNTVRPAKVVWIPGAQGTSLNVAFAHLSALMKRETGMTSTKAATPSASSRPQTPTTEPGKGLAPADIRGIALHSETGIGVGGMVLIVWRPYLLLKNGTMYEHPEVSPYDLDVPKSKEQEPEKWGTWQLSGKILTVKRGSKNGVPAKSEQWKESWWAWANPATPNEQLNTSYYSMSGGGNTAMGGSTMTVSSTNITFNNNGQFTYESTGGGSYNGSGSSVTAFSSKNKAGTYKLEGYCIELKFNNGNTTRQSFYFSGNDKSVFGIANRSYILSK